MQLAIEMLGKGGESVVILHGLLGSGQNWRNIAASMAAEGFGVYLPDARNHGNSPHDARHDYEIMVQDLIGLMDQHKLEKAHLIGHSMGAMVAMLAACRFPERVLSLTSVDFAPRAYRSLTRPVLDAMRALDFTECKSRQDTSLKLEADLKDRGLTLFVMTNLRQDGMGGWKWRVNVPALTQFTEHMESFTFPDDLRYPGPTLFLRGDRSDYVKAQDEPLIRRHFPAVRIETIANAGHWMHADKPNAVLASLLSWFKACKIY